MEDLFMVLGAMVAIIIPTVMILYILTSLYEIKVEIKKLAKK